MGEEGDVSSALIWQSVPFVLYIHPSLVPLQPAHSQLQTLFSGEKEGGGEGSSQMSPCSQQQLLLDLAILLHKRGVRTGVSAHLCAWAPPVVFLLFVPIDEGVGVLAAAFVRALFW